MRIAAKNTCGYSACAIRSWVLPPTPSELPASLRLLPCGRYLVHESTLPQFVEHTPHLLSSSVHPIAARVRLHDRWPPHCAGTRHVAQPPACTGDAVAPPVSPRYWLGALLVPSCRLSPRRRRADSRSTGPRTPQRPLDERRTEHGARHTRHAPCSWRLSRVDVVCAFVHAGAQPPERRASERETAQCRRRREPEHTTSEKHIGLLGCTAAVRRTWIRRWAGRRRWIRSPSRAIISQAAAAASLHTSPVPFMQEYAMQPKQLGFLASHPAAHVPMPQPTYIDHTTYAVDLMQPTSDAPQCFAAASYHLSPCNRRSCCHHRARFLVVEPRTHSFLDCSTAGDG
jgi:hypothetical protein